MACRGREGSSGEGIRAQHPISFSFPLPLCRDCSDSSLPRQPFASQPAVSAATQGSSTPPANRDSSHSQHTHTLLPPQPASSDGSHPQQRPRVLTGSKAKGSWSDCTMLRCWFSWSNLLDPVDTSATVSAGIRATSRVAP